MSVLGRTTRFDPRTQQGAIQTRMVTLGEIAPPHVFEVIGTLTDPGMREAIELVVLDSMIRSMPDLASPTAAAALLDAAQAGETTAIVALAEVLRADF